jgi:hypothetical protein
MTHVECRYTDIDDNGDSPFASEYIGAWQQQLQRAGRSARQHIGQSLLFGMVCPASKLTGRPHLMKLERPGGLAGLGHPQSRMFGRFLHWSTEIRSASSKGSARLDVPEDPRRPHFRLVNLPGPTPAEQASSCITTTLHG